MLSRDTLHHHFPDVVTWRHCDDLEGRDLLHGGRAGRRYSFAALNLGLEPIAKEASASCLAEHDLFQIC
jgi:hypothetical protein